MKGARHSNVNRWRAKQSEVARRRRGGRGARWVYVVWFLLFAVTVGLLVQVIALLFETANATGGRVNDAVHPRDGGAAVALRGGEPGAGPAAAQAVGEPEGSGPEPNLAELTRRLREALAPFQQKYLASIGEPLLDCTNFQTTWQRATPGYLPGCPRHGGCKHFADLEEAKAACEEQPDCGGLTSPHAGRYELRGGRVPHRSSGGETSLVRTACARKATAAEVWEAFRETIETALDDDETLHLSTLYKTREDNSFFLAISSYRDRTCPHTLANAFKNARYPERLFVGIVQQNCDARTCFTGTGWADTRRWVRQDGQDVDCIAAFCETNKELCERQVRILRLSEREAYGPFFGRFLNSKMYRGENYYLQIDAHTYFRKDWDHWMIDQMKRTPSYPNSVISSYPPGGDPTNTATWPAPTGYNEGPPDALCGCTFENAGAHRKTVRLAQNRRSFGSGVDATRPHHSAFVAAGFLVAHGSIVNNVPFDPFMPYLFMGEEISLSIRFWTSGYDIYAPAVELLRHEYVRKESPKFWESVTMIFSEPIHNQLTDLIIPRVQHLVGWKEDHPSELDSTYTRAEEYSNGVKRTAAQFVQTMNIQVRSLRQRAPDWCLQGLDQPDLTSAHKNNNNGADNDDNDK